VAQEFGVALQLLLREEEVRLWLGERKGKGRTLAHEIKEGTA